MSRRYWAASHSEPEMIRLFPRPHDVLGTETGRTNSCTPDGVRLSKKPLRPTGRHAYGSDTSTCCSGFKEDWKNGIGVMDMEGKGERKTRGVTA